MIVEQTKGEGDAKKLTPMAGNGSQHVVILPEEMQRIQMERSNGNPDFQKESRMAGSVYKVIELVGTSSESWEKAAETAVETASRSLRDLRIAEIGQLDMQLEDGKVKNYRAKVKVSFKYHGED